MGNENDKQSSDESVQWVLQPRGGARVRGLEHFERSVEEGISLKGHREVLGQDEAALKKIFPGGVAKLWGATPTQATGHVKAVALREQKVGDEVLFYADKMFVARARILGLFRNPALAESVWGVDEDQRTWEHIMALGDVEPFKVEAAPILTALAMTPPLRSLTLVRAAERRRHLPLLENMIEEWRASKGTLPPESGRTTRTTARLSRDKLLGALADLDRGTPDARTRYAPLMMLWAIGRQTRGLDRIASRDVIAAEAGPLLAAYGTPEESPAPVGERMALEYAFRRLRDNRVWDVEGADEGVEGSGNGAGLRKDAEALLRKPRVRADAIGLLRRVHFRGVDQDALLSLVGLAGYASASGVEGDEPEDRPGDDESLGRTGRRQVNTSRPDRDPRLAKRVKEIYENRCQVCRTRVERQFYFYSEAAHIQGLGRPHEGPDKLSNLLCFCPNCHVEFDGLAIYIDEEWHVRYSRDGELKSEDKLFREAEHAIDEEFLEYHRGLCGLNYDGADSD
ncbi:HNH endonuclease [Streptomyces sp. NPDC004539]|uniref:HNH endonuclease n=1 Tax=Streptomyces sp. NPDC004539 TaxID=3154280 RepID=UPI0033A1B5E9